MATTAVLWDIDGTLIRSNGVGAASFEQAIQTVTGSSITSRIPMAGKTDPQIAMEWLEALGVAQADELLPKVLAELQVALLQAEAELRRVGHVLPGILELLKRLDEHEKVLQSTCTGNIKPNAQTKLEAFGLSAFIDLEVGAFGSDHPDRNRLVPLSIERMRSLRDTEADTVWVIGDTPRDLECARAGGAKCLLVATGGYTLDQLLPLGADWVANDLSDAQSVAELLLS